MVDPLLSTFDFSGVCNRYIDGNGYSLRIGGDDLGTRYRLSVVKSRCDLQLLATPTKNLSEPTMLVARAGGPASGFVQLNLEPGWTLKRRAYGNKSLGHLYVYRDTPIVARPTSDDAAKGEEPKGSADQGCPPKGTEPKDPASQGSTPKESDPEGIAPTPSY